MNKTKQILMAGVIAALSFLAVSSAIAKTLLWYHFDEGTIDQKAAYGATVVNAVGSSYGGVIDCYLDTKTFGNNNNVLPVYRAAFPAEVKIYDPVSGTLHENGKALEFKTYGNQNHPASAVRITDGNQLMPAQFTIEMFVKATAEWKQAEHILKSSAWDLWANNNGSGPGRFKYKGMTAASVNGNGLISDLRWHHIAVVKSASRITFYTDYIESNHVDESTTVDYTTVTDVVLGANLGSTWGGYQGYIDEVRISDTALSPSQFLHVTIAKKSVDPDVYFHFSGEDYNLEAFGALAHLATNLYSYANLSSNGSLPNDAIVYQPGNKLEWNSTYGAKPALMTSGLAGELVRQGITNTEERMESIGLQFNANQQKLVDYDAYSARIWVDDPTDKTLAADSFTSECFIKYLSAPVKRAQHIMYQSCASSGIRKNSWVLSQNYGEYGTFTGQFWYYDENKSYQSVTIPEDTNKRVGIADGEWHHVAVVYDKANKKVTLYLDYQSYGSKENVELIDEPAPTKDERRIQIGDGYYDIYLNTAYQMNGCLDEIRITRRALDPQEFLTTIPVATGKTLFWAGLDTDMTTLPYPGVSPAGVVAQATAALTGRQKKFKYLDDESAEIEKKTGKSLDLNGGKVDFGRNLMLESERTVTVDFLAKIASKTAGAKLVEFKSGNTSVWSVPADAIPVGMWHTVALKVDAASGTQTLFVDGAQVSSGSVTVPESLTDSSFVLGDDGVVGCLDEVRVSRGLLAAEELFRIDPTGLMLLFR